MIITKTPFRVSFCGGGSDLPEFYEKNGGCVVSTSINKYIYMSIHPYFNPQQTVLKYSENEIVDDIGKIKHTIFNCVLNELEVDGVEITSRYTCRNRIRFFQRIYSGIASYTCLL